MAFKQITQIFELVDAAFPNKYEKRQRLEAFCWQKEETQFFLHCTFRFAYNRD